MSALLWFLDGAGNQYPAAGPAWCADDGSPFILQPTIDELSEIDFSLVSIGESPTPVVPFRVAGRDYQCKLECRRPSGSFKDRGARMMVSVLKGLGVSAVVEDSSGNAGAALATYTAAGGIACTIVIPRSARGPVVTQIRMTGARLVRTSGPRHCATELAQQMAGELYYASHIYNPLFYAGTARIAGELIDQRSVPDTIVLPVGNGTLLLGLYHGFKRRGPVPRLIAGQLAGMDPITTEFRRRAGGAQSGKHGTRSAARLAARVAPGIAASHPARLQEIVDAIVETGGEAVSVEAPAVIGAQRTLAERGVYVESTSAVAVAVAEAVDAAGRFGADERVMIVLTGSGLKR
ncbi:MAG: pyridoxal-phosphate dependent enzyme [Spirochaetia bacterium]